MEDLPFLEKLSNNSRGARKTIPSARKDTFEIDLMHSSLIKRNAMPRGINVQSGHMSNSLNLDLSQLTSTSNSTSFNTSGSKVDISKIKIQNFNKQSEVLSESTCGETKCNAMSSQTQTNSVENDREIYGKKLLIPSDFRNNISKKILIQSFQPVRRGDNISDKDFSNTSKGYCCTQVVNYKIPEYPEHILTLAASNKERVTNTLNNGMKNRKEALANVNMDNTYPHHSRRKQARPLKNVRASEKENEKPGTNKITVIDNFPKYKIKRLKTQDTFLSNKTHLPRILIKRDAEGRWFQNYVPSNYVKTVRVNNISKTHLLQSEFPKSTESHLRSTREVKSTLAQPSTSHIIRRSLLYKPIRTVTGSDANTKQYILQQPTAAMQHALGGTMLACLAARKNTKPSTDYQGHYQLDNVSKNFGRNGNLTMREAQQTTTCNTKNPNASSIAPLILMLPRANDVQQNVPGPVGSHCGIRSSNVLTVGVDEKAATSGSITSDDSAATCKIKKTKFVLMKIVELLLNISEALSSEHECPAGLELSLPIWKSELDKCIVSVEKIQSILSEKEKR